MRIGVCTPARGNGGSVSRRGPRGAADSARSADSMGKRDSATGDCLAENGRKAAALLLEYLQIKKFPKISLTGHADERGTDELNLALSRERLATVERFLRESGFVGELELVPKGESEPFSGVERGDYELEDLYQLDRRVELIISR